MHDAREEEKGRAEPIHPIKIMNAQRSNPDDLFRELQAPAVLVIGEKEVCRQAQRNPGEYGADPLDLLLAPGRKEKDHDQARQGREK